MLTGGNTIADTLAMVEQDDMQDAPETFALVSLHRYETITDSKRMTYIVGKLLDLSEKMPLRLILHPPTSVALKTHGLMQKLEEAEHIELLPRMTFIAFQRTLAQAALLVSDGGSNQEESAYLGVPCLLLREKSERLEGLGKSVVLSCFDEQVIDEFFDNYQKYAVRTKLDGLTPSERIVNYLESFA